MTSKKPRECNGMVGGPEEQTESKRETTWLFDCKYQPGLAFDPLFTCKNQGRSYLYANTQLRT